MSRGIILPVLVSILILGGIGLSNAFASHNANHDATGDGNSGAIHQQQDSIDVLTALLAALEAEITALQSQIGSLLFVQTDLTKPVLEIQVDPLSTAPALIVNDGTDPLFIVNSDGSIQIGSNTIIIRPDGTVDGGPLFMQSGSTVAGNLISTGPHTVDTDTTYLAGTGLNLIGTTFSVDTNNIQQDLTDKNCGVGGAFSAITGSEFTCQNFDTRYSTGPHTTLTEAQVDAFANNNGYSTGAHTTDTNTNAGTLCASGQYLDGDGTCKAIPSDTGIGTLSSQRVLGPQVSISAGSSGVLTATCPSAGDVVTGTNILSGDPVHILGGAPSGAASIALTVGFSGPGTTTAALIAFCTSINP